MSAEPRGNGLVLPADIVEVEAERRDLDAIVAIEGTEFPVPWRRDYFAQELTQPQRYNRVLRRTIGAGSPFGSREETVGYLFCSYLLDEMHVNKIATRRDLWSLGLGRCLMARAIDFAREHGVALMTLEVRLSNRRAIEFYERHDFSPIYVRKEYYQDGEDALVMHCTLS